MIGFGVVSLAVDLVADGARSIVGPLLGELGATALVVGLVTGAAEALGFVLRLVTGPLVDRTRLPRAAAAVDAEPSTSGPRPLSGAPSRTGLVGVLLWGAATGIQDSTVPAQAVALALLIAVIRRQRRIARASDAATWTGGRPQ